MTEVVVIFFLLSNVQIQEARAKIKLALTRMQWSCRYVKLALVLKQWSLMNYSHIQLTTEKALSVMRVWPDLFDTSTLFSTITIHPQVQMEWLNNENVCNTGEWRSEQSLLTFFSWFDLSAKRKSCRWNCF